MNTGHGNWMSRRAMPLLGTALVLLASMVLGAGALARAAETGTGALQPLETWSGVALEGRAVRWIDPLPGDAQVVYAAVDGLGVYRSQDGGSSWAALSTAGLANLAVQTVAACPNGSLFAGTWGGGVFRLQGSSWVAVNSGLFRPYITALACDPQSIVYAGTYDAGIFKSTNSGSTWSTVNTGLQSQNVLTVRSGPGYLMAGTSGGAFKSANGGTNWNAAGLPNQAVFDFAFDPLDDQRLWAATTTLGVLASTTGGASWAQVGNGLQAYTVARNAAGELFAGTRDNGAFKLVGDQWVDQGIAPRRVYLIRSAGTTGDRVIAGTDSGIWLGRPVVSPTSTPTSTATPTSTPTAPVAPNVAMTLRNMPLGAANPGDVISYTVDYVVEGEDIAANVMIFDQVPAGTELVAGSPEPDDIALVQGDVVSWDVGNLPAGSSGKVSYAVRVLGTPAPAPTATPTATEVSPLEPTATATPTPTLTTTAEPVRGPAGLQLPQADAMLRQVDGTVVVINDGAEVTWEFQGDLYEARSGPAINGPTYFFPLALRQPADN